MFYILLTIKRFLRERRAKRLLPFLDKLEFLVYHDAWGPETVDVYYKDKPRLVYDWYFADTSPECGESLWLVHNRLLVVRPELRKYSYRSNIQDSF